MDVDELIAIINNAKKEHGAEYVEIYEHTSYQCGNDEHESYELEFYKRVEESDDEYNTRINRDKIAQETLKKERAIKILKAKEKEKKEIEKEKETLNDLMLKYPGIVKNRKNK